MKKTILGLAVAEIIISCGMHTNAQAATINNSNDTNKNTATISTLQKSEKVISIGSSGDVVRSIQRVLNSLGGYNVKEDGLFGSETYNAIIKYQGENGLKQDGIVGKQTVAKLLLDIDANPKLNIKNATGAVNVKTVEEKIQSQLNSKEINSNTDYFIAVNKSQKQVYIYHKENNYWASIKALICNVGGTDSPTIEGDFSTGLKGKELKINEMYLKYFTQISGNYLFHSIPYNEEGQVIEIGLDEVEGNESIILSLEDAKYIYDTIPARTGIKIIN